MARAKIIAAGILLGTGLAISLLNTSILLNRGSSTNSRFFSTLALVLFGFPSLTIGSRLVLKAQDEAKQEQEQLQTSFYNLLKLNCGKINVLQLAIEAKISGPEAKAFLDDRAKEFNANFEVSEGGKVFYYFDLGAAPTTELSSGEQTYSVILEKPSDGWDSTFWGSSILNEVESCIKGDLPAAARKQIKRARYPVTIARGLSKEEAKKMRKDLEYRSRLNVEIQPTE